MQSQDHALHYTGNASHGKNGQHMANADSVSKCKEKKQTPRKNSISLQL